MPSVRETLTRRNEIKAVYPNASWARRVDQMSADQIFAIYQNLKAQNKL